MARPLRTSLVLLVALLAVGASVGACSGDDDDGGDDGGAAVDERPALVDDACELLDLAEISQVTGLTFDDAVTSLNQCIFTSSEGRSAISLNLFTTGGKTAAEAVAVGTAACDAGTVSDIASEEVGGGFACLEDGTPTVSVVSHDDVVYLLKGATLNDGAQAGPLLQQLSQLLAEAVLS